MIIDAVQDYYSRDHAICYGCGRNNVNGLHIRTRWDGKEGLFRFWPKPYHTAFPGVVYGGLIASLIDCHSIGTCIAAAYDAEGRSPQSQPEITFVTGTLNVTYLEPTPIDQELVLRARVKARYDRKTIVLCSLWAGGKECARGEVVGVRVLPQKSGLKAS